MSFSYGGEQATGKMIDENTFIIKFEREQYTLFNIFTYQEENVELQLGKYRCSEIELNLVSANTIIITISNNGQDESKIINGTYSIYGNRIIVKSNDATYGLIIRDVQDSGFGFRYLMEDCSESADIIILNEGVFIKQNQE